MDYYNQQLNLTEFLKKGHVKILFLYAINNSNKQLENKMSFITASKI